VTCGNELGKQLCELAQFDQRGRRVIGEEMLGQGPKLYQLGVVLS
jgi:hypothetical protein